MLDREVLLFFAVEQKPITNPQSHRVLCWCEYHLLSFLNHCFLAHIFTPFNYDLQISERALLKISELPADYAYGLLSANVVQFCSS